MRKTIMAFTCTALLAVSGCTGMTAQDQLVIGGLTGATVGLITARVFDADRNWTIIAGLGGAAVGAMVARNNVTQECAYARGDGTYVVRRC